MDPFINRLNVEMLELDFQPFQELSQKSKYSKSSTVENGPWDGMRNEQNSELNA